MKRWCALAMLIWLVPVQAGEVADRESFVALLEFVGDWEIEDGEWLDPMDVDALIDVAGQPPVGVANEQETSDE